LGLLLFRTSVAFGQDFYATLKCIPGRSLRAKKLAGTSEADAEAEHNRQPD